MQIISVESIGMTVADMERSLDFYTIVLSCKKISDREVAGVEFDQLYDLSNVRLRVAKLQLGNEAIELTEFLTPKGRPIPLDSRSNDRWFQHMAIVVRDMEQAYQHLRQHWVSQTSPNPQTLPDRSPFAGGVQAFYFKDIDGHNLELIHFPEGKGDPKWQHLTESLFLGIDHTAIVVVRTAASLKLYCDILGMEQIAQSKNTGTEQEHLSGVKGARACVTSLKSSLGAGIEFLEYLTPNDGRSTPADSRTNDLWCWQTTLVVPDVVAVAQQLRTNGTQFISTDVIELPEPHLGFKKGFLIRDLDGHGLRLVEK